MRRLMTFGISTTVFVAGLAGWMILVSSPDASAQSCAFVPPDIGACTQGINGNSATDAGKAAYYGAYFADISDASMGATAIYGSSNHGFGIVGVTSGVEGTPDAHDIGVIPAGVTGTAVATYGVLGTGNAVYGGTGVVGEGYVGVAGSTLATTEQIEGRPPPVAVYAQAGAGYGVWADTSGQDAGSNAAVIATGGTSATGYGVYATNGAGTGIAVYAVNGGGTTAATTGSAIYGSSGTADAIVGDVTTQTGRTGAHGVTGVAANSLSAGVYGTNSLGAGVIGESTGGGDGVTGVATAGIGVFGKDTTSGYGVDGYSATGVGVVGIAESGTLPTSKYGVYGSNSAGDAVHGLCTNGNAGVSGNNSGGGYALWGQVTGSTTGTAVYGIDSVSGVGSHYAGNFVGNVKVSGCLDVTSVGGGTTGTCSSDARLKKNIDPLKDGLGRLTQLKPVTYQWIDPTSNRSHGGTGIQTGFLAQDVEKVFPEWVGVDSDGFKTLALPPTALVALEVEALRTLKADNDKQQIQIGNQQAQIDDLRKHMKAIEDGHPIPASTGFNFGGANVGLLGLAAAIAYAASRRKQGEKRA